MNKTISPLNVARQWFIERIPVDVVTDARVNSLASLIVSERTAERERCAKVAQEISKQQERDYGSANSGGADACVAAILALK